jgi:conjugative transfer signal peptidase TraF
MSVRWRTLRWLAALAFLVVAGVSLAGHYGVRMNTTTSIPLGLYRRTMDARAPYIVFCPTQAQAQVANERGFRSRGFDCPDGFEPLIKPIRARQGDIVTVTARGIFVNDAYLSQSAAKHLDGSGRPLPRYPEGTYTVPPGMVWGISSYNASSFDSRYFGPISLSGAYSYAYPVWTF